MITNFEEITYELTDLEKTLIPLLIAGFSNRTKDNPIKEPQIVSKMKEYKLTSARLRKCINFIRANGLLPIIGTSKGYYVSYDSEEIKKQIASLNQRANSIIRCAQGLQKYTV